MQNSTERFSSRVENYIKSRPTYPPGVIELLREKCGLSQTSIVADIGSGTGLLTELFLKEGAKVFGVEPNREMREAGERLLQAYSRFHSVNGTAEATTLSPASIDLVVAGQAFHWFDVEKTSHELRRVLKSPGWAALVWNERPPEAHPFLSEYETLLRRHAADYDRVTNSRVDETKIGKFFDKNFELATFENYQCFDYAGLEGRLMSSSFAPEPGHPEHEPMIAGLHEIFARHQQNGEVLFPYQTLLYFGRVNDE